MRGEEQHQSEMFHYFSVEGVVPESHPIRHIRKLCDEALSTMSDLFDAMYSDTGRPSIAPEVLLKSQVLIALYSVRSDVLFCEMLGYNILFRWFLGMDMSSKPFDASTFSKNRARLIEHEAGKQFLAAVVELARKQRLLSHEHFTVDGTLIESWASLKSFRRKDNPSGKGGEGSSGGSNPEVNFRGEKRSNKTHCSTTDPEARLFKKGGKEAKLYFMGHSLMENRNGFIVDVELTTAGNTEERDAVLTMLDRQGMARGTIGADKSYHAEEFVRDVRARGIVPHIAYFEGHKGLDRRTLRHATYQVSQRKRKLVEQGFGWLKVIGGIRKSLVVGIAKTAHFLNLKAATYDLVRLAKFAAG